MKYLRTYCVNLAGIYSDMLLLSWGVAQSLQRATESRRYFDYSDSKHVRTAAGAVK